MRRDRCPAGVFVAALHEDRQDYERAAELQREALATLEGVGRPEATWPGNTPENSGIRCDATGVQPRGWLYEDSSATPYGTARFVDVRTRASETIHNQQACERALARFQRPGAGG